jgi:hypothetical protein
MQQQLIVRDQGPIAELSVPSSWVMHTEEFRSYGQRSLVQLLPLRQSDQLDWNTTISVFYRGFPVSEAGAARFHQLLKQILPNQAPKFVFGDTLKDLAEILGDTTVGDNQYTNPPRPGSDMLPLFFLQTAQIADLNGRIILSIEGYFTKENGDPLRYFSGIFIDTDGSGAIIHEVFLQAKSKDEMMMQKSVYRNALKSIKWAS